MKRKASCVIIGLIISGFYIFSPGNLTALEKKMAQATQTTVPIKIDGILKETSWKSTPPLRVSVLLIRQKICFRKIRRPGFFISGERESIINCVTRLPDR